MYSKFPFSMENIPRQRSFGCLSLKFGCIFSGIIVIIYSLLAISQLFVVVSSAEYPTDGFQKIWILVFIMIVMVTHFISFVLSVVMLYGAFRRQAEKIKPWVVWKSMEITASIFLFVLWGTMNMVNQFDENTVLLYVVELLVLLIRFYMLMLVASYYKQLQGETEETESLKNILNQETWYTEEA